MVPIWRKNKGELTDEDYVNFYNEKRYGFDKPLKHIHVKADGAVVYNAILFIPENTPFDYYTKEYEKGLELYSNGVLIMDKCGDLAGLFQLRERDGRFRGSVAEHLTRDAPA